MNEPSCDRDNTAKIIELRVKEYESLRSEVVRRIGTRQQSAGHAGAATAIAATLGSELGYWRIVITSAVVVVAYWYLRDSDDAVQRAGRHLRPVEDDVNALARSAYGREVLSWESSGQVAGNAEKRTWKVVGRTGGWHRDDPSVGVPQPRGDAGPRPDGRPVPRAQEFVRRTPVARVAYRFDTAPVMLLREPAADPGSPGRRVSGPLAHGARRLRRARCQT